MHGSGKQDLGDRPSCASFRIETALNASLGVLADSGRLLCRHPGGVAGVESRFFMSMVAKRADPSERSRRCGQRCGQEGVAILSRRGSSIGSRVPGDRQIEESEDLRRFGVAGGASR